MKKFSFLKLLYAKHKEELLRFALRKLGSPDDAEEIVQDTFHNMMNVESAETLENPRAYLYKTAHNLALNRLRQGNHHSSYLQQCDDTATTVSLERSVIAEDALEHIRATVTKLPTTTQQVFYMSRIEGKTYAAISHELKISVSSVEKHMMKTLKILRENDED
ncbi:RNA polymerase sigma factor [Marinagarivorans cellulosilyticus]|nr:sigma-70 family RNA polymerase sigma factor [Marinagarivorans cellulosilyticus]